jgi:hypothetical protein
MTTITIEEELKLPQTHFKTYADFEEVYKSQNKPLSSFLRLSKNKLSKKDLDYFMSNKISLNLDPLLFQQQIRNEW